MLSSGDFLFYLLVFFMPVFSSFSFSRIVCLFTASVFLLTLSGCSSNFKSFTDSFKAAAELSKGANVSPEYIASIPYASNLVTINDNKPIFMVLAFADQYDKSAPHQLTWLAKDSGSIVTQNGRIVQTNGFDSNNLAGLAHSSISRNLPLPGDALDSTLKVTYDWSPGYRYGFTATVETRLVGRETLVTDLWREDVEHFTETVTFDQLDAQFTNHFWRVPATDTLPAYIIKSIQYLGPNMDRVEMQAVRPFVEPAPMAAQPSDAERFMGKQLLLPEGGRFSLALQDAHRQTAFWPLNDIPYSLGTALVDLSKQPLVDQQKEQVIKQLQTLNTPAANTLAKHLITMRFAYHEDISHNVVQVRVNPRLDPLLNSDFWLSLPARPDHIRVLHPLKEDLVVLPSRADFHVSKYLAELTQDTASDTNLPPVHTAWVIQADRRVYPVTDLQWRDTRYYLSPGAMVFVGLEDLPHAYRDLNANIAQLLALRLEL